MLRGLAASLVVFHHVCQAVESSSPRLSFINSLYGLSKFGAVGVDIFFVISGFIMVFLTTDPRRKQLGAFEFLRMRIIRIVPLYWIYTTAMLFLVASPFAFRAHTFGWSFILKSYLFIPGYNSSGKLHPLLDQGWTLNYEMYFYLIFTAFLGIARPKAVAYMSLAMAGSITIAFAFPLNFAPYTFFTEPIVLEFCLGMLAGILYNRGSLPNRKLTIAFLTLALAIWALTIRFSFDMKYRFVFSGIPAFSVVLALLALEKQGRLPKSSSWLLLGDASYSIYLTHAFFTLALAAALKTHMAAVIPSMDLLIVAAIPLFLLPGILSYRFLEQPLTKWLRTVATQQSKNVPHGDNKHHVLI